MAFFERLQEQFGDLPAALAVISSHPSHEERRAMFAEAGSGGRTSLSDADWQTLKSICGTREEPESHQ